MAQRFHVDLNSEEIRLAQREIEATHAAKGWRAPLFLFSRDYLLATVFFAVISFCALYMIYGINTWLTQLMALSGYSLTSALLFLLVLNFGNIIGNVIAGAAADRFGSKIIIQIVFALAAISFFLLSIKVPLLVGYLLVILVGNGAFGAQNLLNAYIAKFYPVNSRGTAVGWALGIGRSGGFVSPNLIGLFLFWHVPLQWSFYALAIPGALSVVLLLFMPKTPMLNEQVGASTALSASTEVS